MCADSSAVELRYIQAVNHALRWAMREYPEALIFGEDVAIPGGPFGATKGLRNEFGDRVFDTPISESAFVGAAIGAAMRGRRPIVEIMFADFTLVAMDQIVNQLANVRYVSEGRYTAPVTIRTQGGYTPGACAQHCQSLEAFFAHVPGLRVGLPAYPQDAYDMLRSAIAHDDPVLIIENRSLYPDKGTVVLDRPVEPLGHARVVCSGEDLTIVSWSRMVREAEKAAEALSSQGISAEVIDLRWLSPLDFETVRESLGRTGRLIIAHEANRTGGFGAEIAARVAEEAFDSLDSPIVRVATPDVRIPAAPALQAALIPGAERLIEAAEKIVRQKQAVGRSTSGS